MRVVAGDAVAIDGYRVRPPLPDACPAGTAPAQSPSGTAGAGWVSRLAPAFNLPITRQRRTLATPSAVPRHPVEAEPSLDACGLPVLLIGGLAGTAERFRLLEEWLSRLNCHVRIASIGSGVDCGERTVAGLTEQLSALAEERGQRCVLIGHSRGGQLARVISVRRPELVRGLVVLGSPLNRLLGVHPWLKAEVVMLGLAGTLGLPGLLRPSCLWGTCCRRFRSDIAAPFPDDVSFLSLFSKQDRTVDWRSSLDPDARHREVSATHSGLLTAPEVCQVLAEELRRVTTGQLVSVLR